MTETVVESTTLSLVQGDITQQDTDAIVNAANTSLMGGGGVDGAIHRKGGPAILEECKQIIDGIGRLSPGKAVMTTGGNLKARHVIHTVGPVWRGGSSGEPLILDSAYRECLRLASEASLKSLAFPSISTGAFGYPLDKAAKTALTAVIGFLKEYKTPLKEILFVLFDSRTFNQYQATLSEVAADQGLSMDK